MMSMEERLNDMDALVDKLAAKEKKRRRNALFYLALPILAGVVLIFWTGWQAETIDTQKEVVQVLEDSTTNLQVQLVQTRQATEFIKTGLASYYAGNYSAAIRQYDKAIELDSLNPVVLELKSESLIKKGEVQKASEILDKAVKADSIQQNERTDILHYLPKSQDRLKALKVIEKMRELKPDSQDVIRRKLKARELKPR
jgi:tetratricopeptide (TPR) repeat protein